MAGMLGLNQYFANVHEDGLEVVEIIHFAPHFIAACINTNISDCSCQYIFWNEFMLSFYVLKLFCISRRTESIAKPP